MLRGKSCRHSQYSRNSVAINLAGNGEFIQEITRLFPGQEVHRY